MLFAGRMLDRFETVTRTRDKPQPSSASASEDGGDDADDAGQAAEEHEDGDDDDDDDDDDAEAGSPVEPPDGVAAGMPRLSALFNCEVRSEFRAFAPGGEQVASHTRREVDTFIRVEVDADSKYAAAATAYCCPPLSVAGELECACRRCC